MFLQNCNWTQIHICDKIVQCTRENMTWTVIKKIPIFFSLIKNNLFKNLMVKWFDLNFPASMKDEITRTPCMYPVSLIILLLIGIKIDKAPLEIWELISYVTGCVDPIDSTRSLYLAHDYCFKYWEIRAILVNAYLYFKKLLRNMSMICFTSISPILVDMDW